MIYDVTITDKAEVDLREIYEYIAFSLLAPENAKKQLDRLETHIMELSNLPYRFREYDKEPWRSRGLRVMPVDNFVVFYIPDDEGQIVSVIRVMYEGRDIDSEFRQ